MLPSQWVLYKDCRRQWFRVRPLIDYFTFSSKGYHSYMLSHGSYFPSKHFPNWMLLYFQNSFFKKKKQKHNLQKKKHILQKIASSFQNYFQLWGFDKNLIQLQHTNHTVTAYKHIYPFHSCFKIFITVSPQLPSKLLPALLFANTKTDSKDTYFVLWKSFTLLRSLSPAFSWQFSKGSLQQTRIFLSSFNLQRV